MNIWDILILAVILAAVAAAFRVMKSKNGRGGCGCGCDGCTKSCASRQNGPDKTKQSKSGMM
jgi:hypothetical protein